MKSPPQMRIGISGWTYAPWRGVFYPPKLPHRSELEYASSRLNSIEINGTFYSLQRPDSYRNWRAQTPDDFMFSVKCSRFITHLKRLNDVQVPLANFLASGIFCLKEKLGPMLWQFPPQMKFDEARFDTFFRILPRTFADAEKIALSHDQRVEGRGCLLAEHSGTLRHAVEVRHISFKTPEFIKLLRKHKIALVFADTAGRWPYMEDVTADFIYIRLHGDKELYVSGYSDDALDWWAERIRLWRAGREPDGATTVARPAKPCKSRDVYVYFDNDVKVRAPFDAMNLAERLL